MLLCALYFDYNKIPVYEIQLKFIMVREIGYCFYFLLKEQFYLVAP